MRPVISFLIGSGFSIPEGLPSVAMLNKRLSKIDESEILIHTDQRAIWLKNVADDPNRWSRWDERLFLQEFLDFYNTDILETPTQFHYETFYDFYSSYLAKRENQDVIEGFNKRFNEKHFKNSHNYRDCYNRIADFNRSYNQLLASQLHNSKYFEDVSTLNYPPYDSFIGFIRELLKTCDIKFHTLNHDLFFDWLGRHHADLWEHFTDGYQLAGSPFYGTVEYDFNRNSTNRIHKTYYVKLERFIDKFDKPLALFKLHGSIFSTIVYTPHPKQERVRLKDNYAIRQYFMEVNDENSGEPKLELLWDEVAPDFLSGTTNKTRYYSNDPYYQNLFKHFENNLSSSENLIVIGYGFQDIGVNEYLEKHFLTRGKEMIVIDPFKPKTDLIDKYKAIYIEKGVTKIDFESYLKLLPSFIKKN